MAKKVKKKMSKKVVKKVSKKVSKKVVKKKVVKKVTKKMVRKSPAKKVGPKGRSTRKPSFKAKVPSPPPVQRDQYRDQEHYQTILKKQMSPLENKDLRYRDVAVVVDKFDPQEEDMTEYFDDSYEDGEYDEDDDDEKGEKFDNIEE